MKVYWTPKAESQLDSIYRYIANESPVYALRTIERIFIKERQLELFPMSGRSVPAYRNENVREIISGSYRIVYRIEADQIEIISVIHTARELPQND
jgi:toxin ParE1/3/4